MLKDEIPCFVQYAKFTEPQSVITNEQMTRINTELLPKVAIIPIEQPNLANYDRLVV